MKLSYFKLSFFSALGVAVAIGLGSVRADDMQGMDMKGMAPQAQAAGTETAPKTHHAVGMVKKVDAAKGTVTISHGAVKTLDWPAMTMTFRVKDASLLRHLSEGKKVEVDFVQEGSDYTIVKVK